MNLNKLNDCLPLEFYQPQKPKKENVKFIPFPSPAAASPVTL